MLDPELLCVDRSKSSRAAIQPLQPHPPKWTDSAESRALYSAAIDIESDISKQTAVSPGGNVTERIGRVVAF